MSKELNALKRLTVNKYANFLRRNEDITIIEQALKDKEKTDKALKIIKDKNVFVWGFVHSKEEKKDFEWTYAYYKTHYGYFHSGYVFELLTEKEFELLKEVLLCEKIQ